MTDAKIDAAPSRVDLPYVEAELGYPTKEDPTLEGHKIHVSRIHDARPIAGDLSLDREGFTLMKHKSALAEKGDYGLLLRESAAYADELTPAIKELMGASWVVARRGGVVVRSATKIDPANPRGYARNKGGVEAPYPTSIWTTRRTPRSTWHEQRTTSRGFRAALQPARHHPGVARLLPPASGPPPGDHGRLDAGRIGHVRTAMYGRPLTISTCQVPWMARANSTNQ